MAKEEPQSAITIEFETADRTLLITLAANEIAVGDPQANPYETRNALLEARRVARVRYKNGVTLPAPAAKLRADAERKVRHSRILERNIRNATGQMRHPEADTHHVVAQADSRAKGSRNLLFRWGIGINDADNGLYLRKTWKSRVPDQDSATAHDSIHTLAYHLAVFARLESNDNNVGGRAELRDIKREIISDSFIY